VYGACKQFQHPSTTRLALVRKKVIMTVIAPRVYKKQKRKQIC